LAHTGSGTGAKFLQQLEIRLEGRGRTNMLSPEDNEILTRVGPGTPMGDLIRRFWMPALLEEELAGPDGAPVKLRLLGEDLVAFKDTDGRIGILDAYCPHRRVQLYYGRNEECGLRCVYHGWKFDVDGVCTDMPSEPDETNFSAKVSLTAYPVLARGGVVWVYMGPKENIPEPPEFEWSRLAPMQRVAAKRLQKCNWAQATEGGVDSAHISYLHSKIDPDHPVNAGLPGGGQSGDRHPVFEVKETNYGLLIGARREREDKYWWRITQFLVPFYQMIPGPIRSEDMKSPHYGGHAWVPIDDENTWTWSFGASPDYEYTPAQRQNFGPEGNYWGPVDAEYNPVQNDANDYGLDRKVQRAGNYTGIAGIPNQDAAVQESMGPIVDRSKERLGQSDTAIIQFRKLLLRLAAELKAGKEPEAPAHGDWYNVRSVAVALEKDVPFDEGAAPYFAGIDIAKAAE
jgi:phthalate 4,5-dioxygenase oxygenase subunit